MNKKGTIAPSIVVIMVVLFMFSVMSLIAAYMTSEYIDAINSLPNETAAPEIKEKIEEFSTRVIGWSDRLFMTFFIVLLIGFIISAVTLPPDDPIYFLIYTGVLVIVTILAGIFSNAWAYISEDPNFISALANVPIQDYFMTYFPIIMFFIGLVGAIIFYARFKRSTGIEGASDGFE